MLTGAFHFDTVAHVYTVGGVVIPGHTSVLADDDADAMDPDWFQPEHRARGSAVHAATLAWDLGDTPTPLPVEWQGFYRAYLAFRASVVCRFTLLETPRVSRTLRYAATIDRAGLVNTRETVLEIKTGGPAHFHGPQTAGQDLLLPGARGTRRRMVVYLSADGKFKLREYTSAGDYAVFLGALDRYWRRRDGKTHRGIRRA